MSPQPTDQPPSQPSPRRRGDRSPAAPPPTLPSTDRPDGSIAAPAPPRRVVTVSSAGDFLAAVPYLIGFRPTASVVVVSLRGRRSRCGLVARIDLPQGAPDEIHQWASSLVGAAQRDGARAVVVAVYDELPWQQVGPPHAGLVDELTGAFAEVGIAVRDALYVTGERFWSFTCGIAACCPPQGKPLDASRCSEVAATYVLEGRAPLASRDALAARLAPAGPLTLAATGAAADLALREGSRHWQADGEAAWRRWQVDTVRLVDRVACEVIAGGPQPGVDDAGRILAGLLDRTTRDLVAVRWTRWAESLPDVDDVPGQEELESLGRDCPPAPECGPPGQDRHEALTALLLGLAARAEADLLPAPLVLVAMHAWSGGEGALAGLAVDRALRADPEYRMAVLLDQLLRSGIAPAWVQRDRELEEASAGPA